MLEISDKLPPFQIEMMTRDTLYLEFTWMLPLMNLEIIQLSLFSQWTEYLNFLMKSYHLHVFILKSYKFAQYFHEMFWLHLTIQHSALH